MWHVYNISVAGQRSCDGRSGGVWCMVEGGAREAQQQPRCRRHQRLYSEWPSCFFLSTNNASCCCQGFHRGVGLGILFSVKQNCDLASRTNPPEDLEQPINQFHFNATISPCVVVVVVVVDVGFSDSDSAMEYYFAALSLEIQICSSWR